MIAVPADVDEGILQAALHAAVQANVVQVNGLVASAPPGAAPANTCTVTEEQEEDEEDSEIEDEDDNSLKKKPSAQKRPASNETDVEEKEGDNEPPAKKIKGESSSKEFGCPRCLMRPT
eukprot:12405998-Karenia_brevis.AAC.1